MNITRIRYIFENQILGLLPVFIFLLVVGHYSYFTSFLLSSFVSVFNIFVYLRSFRRGVYQFGLLVATAVLIVYSLFLTLQIQALLYAYASIIVEAILVAILIIIGFFKSYIYKRFSSIHIASFKAKDLKNALDEFFFILLILQNLLTLHFVFYVVYKIVLFSQGYPVNSEFWSEKVMLFLVFMTGAYESFRLFLIHRILEKEVWLPILDENKKVTGHIAKTISRELGKKLYHPIVRVVVVCDNMLYLKKQSSTAEVSPNKFDLPFHRHIHFHQTIEEAAKESLDTAGYTQGAVLEFLLNYDFENVKVKHFVSIFAIRLSIEQFSRAEHLNGKLWTLKQIEENLGKGVFSEYFEQEYDYLKHTVLQDYK